jgi:AcrR family transcriptional regulator
MTESPQINQDDLSKGERTRLTIMQAAVELFARQGYHGTSMRQIADRAGIALGGIYNHFEGKEDIFRQVSLEYHPIHAILPALEADQGNTVEEFVHQAGDKMYTSLSEGEDFLSLMFIEMVEFKGRHLPMIFKQMFPRALDFSQRMQQKRGTLRAEIPLQIMLVTFIGLMFTFFFFYRIFGSTADLGAPREVLHKVMDIYLHGILKNEPQE